MYFAWTPCKVKLPESPYGLNTSLLPNIRAEIREPRYEEAPNTSLNQPMLVTFQPYIVALKGGTDFIQKTPEVRFVLRPARRHERYQNSERGSSQCRRTTNQVTSTVSSGCMMKRRQRTRSSAYVGPLQSCEGSASCADARDERAYAQ